MPFRFEVVEYRVKSVIKSFDINVVIVIYKYIDSKMISGLFLLDTAMD